MVRVCTAQHLLPSTASSACTQTLTKRAGQAWQKWRVRVSAGRVLEVGGTSGVAGSKQGGWRLEAVSRGPRSERIDGSKGRPPRAPMAALICGMYTVRIETFEAGYKAVVLYIRDRAHPRHVPVQYRTRIAASSPTSTSR